MIGAGPTGVELAGQLAELSHRTRRGNFRDIGPADVHVVLLGAGADDRADVPRRSSRARGPRLARPGMSLTASRTCLSALFNWTVAFLGRGRRRSESSPRNRLFARRALDVQAARENARQHCQRKLGAEVARLLSCRRAYRIDGAQGTESGFERESGESTSWDLTCRQRWAAAQIGRRRRPEVTSRRCPGGRRIKRHQPAFRRPPISRQR